MTTYVLKEYGRNWLEISDEVDLEAYGLKLCEEEAYHDNDSGYSFWVEFWRNGVRTYAYAEYDSWDRHYNLEGAMNTFAYGSLEEIHKVDSSLARYVKPSKWAPDRDWIKV